MLSVTIVGELVYRLNIIYNFNMIKKDILQLLLGTVLGAALVFSGTLINRGPVADEEMGLDQLRAHYYASQVATLVSPHSLRGRMDKGDDSYILVDTRAAEDYEREHIVGAVNIDSAESFANVLSAYQALDHSKEIIIYCYSSYCLNGRKVGKFLAENGIYVQEMTVGWNEWRYNWAGWNYETEWDNTDVSDYVISGPEPGVPQVRDDAAETCPIAGGFSC